MLVSLRWLRRHVDLDGLDPRQIALDLTLSTAEVESVEPFLPHTSDVVVGHVLERHAHPDADKLSVCKVDVGGPDVLQIVCGAPNVGAGQRVAVARVGTVLPGDFKIKQAKIRGVDSCGMICSVRELGLGDEHDGIWVLDGEPALGAPVSVAVELEDWVLEIDNKSITHRPDLWGHRGIAGELAAIYRRELLPLDLTLPRTGNGVGVPVRIEDAACPRYLALEVDGVRVTKSPAWLRHLLLAAGQRPLDLLVDVSNFVMLDLGQPNHLFDRREIGPAGIVVRMARAGETMRTLDELERKLGPEDLLICAGDEPVALAGVMGGAGSKVGADTTRLLLEVANFHPTVIRRTAARLGLRTDASARFEKSLDPNLVLQGAAHLVRTLQAIQPGLALPSAPTDVGDWSDPALTLELDPARARALLGAPIADLEMADILKRLGFGVDVLANGRFRVAVPSRRATKDVSIAEDLIEEIGRIFRYGNVAEARLVAAIEPPPRDRRRELVRAFQDRLSGGARFHEALTYSFDADALLTKLGLAGERYVELVNPVVEGEQRVRRTVIPSLLALLEKNRRHHDDVRLFEIGKGYLPEHANERGEPREVHELGLVWCGAAPKQGARFDAGRFPRLQGIVVDLIRAAEHPAPSWRRAEPSELPPWAHPGKALAAELPATAGGTRVVALVTELEPGMHKALGLEAELAGEVAIARVSLDALLECELRELAYRPIPRFPGTKVDVAFAAPEELPAGELVRAIEQAGKGLVAACELFDLYRGEALGAGKKSLAYHVVLQSDERTLADDDGQKFLRRVEAVAAKLGAELRRE